MKHKFSEEIYKTLYTTNPSLAKDYFSSFPEQQKPKIHKVWPIDLKWWQHKKYDDIKKQCKFLDPFLIEVGNKRHRLKLNETKSIVISDGYKSDEFFAKHHYLIQNSKGEDKYKIPALMKANCKISIAKRIGCSVDTAKVYFAMLVRCDVLRVDNFGKGRIYISSGYWGLWQNEDKIWGDKVFQFMNKKLNNKKILDPEFAYLRKPK